MLHDKYWQKLSSPNRVLSSDMCRYHECVIVGNKIISAVGEYFPSGTEEAQTIDDSNYFKVCVLEYGGERCDCGCGLPIPLDEDPISEDKCKTRKTVRVIYKTVWEDYAEQAYWRRWANY